MSAKTKAKPFTAPPVENALPLVEHIPASQFRRYPSNRQISPAQVEKMADSIREVGVIQPITARQVENPETGGLDLEIIIGECRWLGCASIAEDYDVPCFVRIGMSDKEAARIHTVENFQRKDLDEIEEARAIQHLKDTGWTIDEIMTFLGREKTGLYTRLKLLELNEDAHEAIRQGELSLNTACKIAGLPEEKRADALQAVIHPTHAAKALPERQALELLDREFVEPEKRSKEWEKRKRVILENYPKAKWNNYEAAVNLSRYDSGFVACSAKPAYHKLSDAARAEELLVPTWGELAEKHGAPIQIGITHDDEAAEYVEWEPLYDAEITAHNDTPGDCIFPHEAAIAQLREESQRRKMEAEAHQTALEEDKKRLAQLIVSDQLTKTASKKLVETLFLEIVDGSYLDLEEIGKCLGVIANGAASCAEFQDEVEKAVTKYLRSKTMTPWEAMARLQVAGLMILQNDRYAFQAFEIEAIKPADFPALHTEYLPWKKKMEEIAKREEEAKYNINQD